MLMVKEKEEKKARSQWFMSHRGWVWQWAKYGEAKHTSFEVAAHARFLYFETSTRRAVSNQEKLTKKKGQGSLIKDADSVDRLGLAYPFF